MAYEEAFTICTGGQHAIGMDCVPLRQFILDNSCIQSDDLDPHLLQMSTDEGTITVDGFIHVIRDNCVTETAAIESFLGISQNGETVEAEECRSGLLMFAQRNLGANYAEDQWDCIFNTVMWDADRQVSMEKWIYYCKVVGRIARLVHYAKPRS